jgi:hypothetical protein
MLVRAAVTVVQRFPNTLFVIAGSERVPGYTHEFMRLAERLGVASVRLARCRSPT